MTHEELLEKVNEVPKDENQLLWEEYFKFKLDFITDRKS
jgi:hypothetical protein